MNRQFKVFLAIVGALLAVVMFMNLGRWLQYRDKREAERHIEEAKRNMERYSSYGGVR